MGLSVSTTGIMTFLTARSLGKLVDRYSAALILFAMLTLGGFSLFLSSIADSLFIFIMSRAIFGISDAGVNPAIEVQITKMTKPNQLNRSFSYIQSAQPVGVAVGPFIGAFLNTHGGYQLVFSSVSGLYWVLIIAIIVSYLLRRKSD
ncbi:MFS transporter [Oenococcus oeni]|uniref:MFS transporter n=1 Tax=Oenococcus oeni TaxID=1247 RepID=UPI0021B1AEE0|nr:MFS transporter [Oenococcus oeni]